MPSDPASDLFGLLARFHGHRCPMSVLGARLGLASRAALGAPGGGRLRARYHSATCALDGVQVTTGCTLGNRGLEVVPGERHRLELRTEDGRRRVVVEPTAWALEQGRRFGEIRRRCEPLPAGSAERARMEAEMEALLQGLERAPDGRVARILECVP